MIVITELNGTTKTIERRDKDCRLVRNGSMIQIEFIRDGVMEYILVDQISLGRILRKKNHGDTVHGTVTVDEEIK